LDHTIKLSPGGVGGPPKIAILQKNGNDWRAEELPDLQEHQQYISELEGYIGGFARKTIEEAATESPPVAPSLTEPPWEPQPPLTKVSSKD
jgi:hypothetical protein